ncbi:hypothetical protein LXA43DRAFT_1164900 [Ganoderma leucocontextum]|nr:hypothetical protein LXA43DRAFT_1164900 [Ganoderma leucocontextum]
MFQRYIDRRLVLVPQTDVIDHDVNLSFALLSRSYNASLEVPVNRFPPELLGMVFEHLRAPTKLLKSNWSLCEPVFAPYKPLTSAMLVCRQWYLVALEKASLWTDVDCSLAPGQVGANCLLKRSRVAPIHLRLEFDGSAEEKEYFRSVVHTNASRLRQLDLWADSPSMREACQLLGHDMPLLRWLAMSMEPDEIVWVPLPRFRPLAKLTHLYFSWMNDVPFGAIATLLETTPALQALELHQCHGILAPTTLPERTTMLKHLTHLFIRAMFATTANALISSLILPRAAVVSIHLFLDVDLHLLTALLPQPPYWCDIPRILVVGGKDTALSVRLDGEGCVFELCFTYFPSENWEGVEQPEVAWPLPVPALLPLAHVSAAHVCIRQWTLLAPFMAHFPALTTLVVGTTSPAWVDAAMAREMVEALRDLLLQEEPVLCPGLKEVAVLSACLVQDLTELLAPALEKRARDGRRVERLSTTIDLQPDAPPETTPRDVGDALAEYIGAGEVEHDGGVFWSRDERLWRRENVFWDTSNAV